MGNADPYLGKKVSTGSYAAKVEVSAQVVAVLRGQVSDRNLELIPQPSRAVKRGDVHELILTDQESDPGSRVDNIAYLAFVEFQNAGVLLRGDQIRQGWDPVGELLGFDLSHFPNHMNVVARGDLKSGEERGLRPGDTLVFAPAGRDSAPNDRRG